MDKDHQATVRFAVEQISNRDQVYALAYVHRHLVKPDYDVDVMCLIVIGRLADFPYRIGC